jgi:hypothetical protein
MVLAANYGGNRMTKLRVLLATALLTLPALTLSAAQAGGGDAGPGTRLETTSLTGCCWVCINGWWYCVAC